MRSVFLRVVPLLALLFGSWFAIPEALACTQTSERNWANCADAGAAASVVSGAMWSAIVQCNPRNTELVHDPVARTVLKYVTHGGDGVNSVCGQLYPQRTGVAAANYVASCTTRSPLGGGVAGGVGYSGGDVCSNGCRYSGGTYSTTIEMGGKTWRLTDGMTPNGAICDPADQTAISPVQEEDCVQQGTMTSCVKPNGEVCARSSTGKLFCYGDSDAGVKTSQNEASVITPEGVAPKPPTTPPANGGEWIKSGEGTITTTKDGVTTTKTVTTYVSNYGTGGKNTGAEGEQGEGDDDGPTASTGVGCDQASFQCSDMSSVQCNQLIQTWYLRCRGVELNGGANCDAPPTCTGNSADCYVSMQLWNFRCEGKNDTGNATDLAGFDAAAAADGTGTDEPDAASMPMANGSTADLGLWEEKQTDATSVLSGLNASGFLGGSRTCPTLPTVNVAGIAPLNFNLGPICALLANIGIMVQALAYWLAYRIIAKART